jgi:hypothetical protein
MGSVDGIRMDGYRFERLLVICADFNAFLPVSSGYSDFWVDRTGILHYYENVELRLDTLFWHPYDQNIEISEYVRDRREPTVYSKDLQSD